MFLPCSWRKSFESDEAPQPSGEVGRIEPVLRNRHGGDVRCAREDAFPALTRPGIPGVDRAIRRRRPDQSLPQGRCRRELAHGRTAEPTEENAKRFKAITGYDYRAMAQLGDVNRHYADERPDMIQVASVLYDDPLYCGNYRNYLVRKPSETTDRRFYCAHYKDAAWRDDGEKVWADYRAVLKACADLTGIPPAAAALVRTLRDKANYEADLLAAWKAKDRAALTRIAERDLPDLIASMKVFIELYRADWYRTSQPFGFELTQKRNAAALARLEEAQRRLDDWIAGRIPTIEELDETLKPFGKYNEGGVIRW